MKRRGFLQVGGAALLLASVGVARGDERDAFGRESASDALAALFGVTAYESSSEVRFKAPEIAENGAVVPLTASFDGAARRIAFVVEENPAPLAAAFEVAAAGSAFVSTRIKMGGSSMVHAVVETADGRLLGAAKEVKVTIGGCGG